MHHPARRRIRQPGAPWSFRDIAEYLRVSQDRVYRWFYAGELKVIDLSDTPKVHRWLVLDQDFQNFLISRKGKHD
jgi:predicted site-specific integrase-resolvase